MSAHKPIDVIGIAATGVLLGAFLLWLGGWSIAWKEHLYTTEPLYLKDGIALKFNHYFYGIRFSPRLFDSPVISWFLGTLGVMFITSSIASPLNETKKKPID